MENEIVKQNSPVPSAPNSAELIIQNAVEKGLPVETIERLLAMRRELKAEFAKEAFDAAMSRFQQECPIIEKKKEVKDNSGKVLYRYAPIDTIVSQVKDVIGKHGLSYAIKTEIGDTKVKVTCSVKHELGHSEMSDMEVPLGNRTAIMSAPQNVAAATTFAKRYAFCNAFGIITGDEDVDGKLPIEEPQFKTKPAVAPPVKPATPPVASPKVTEQAITTQQIAAIEDLLNTYGMPFMEFLKAYKVKNLNQLTEPKAKAAIATLSKRIADGEMWEQPDLPTIPADEPVKVALPPLVEAEVVTQPTGSPWDKWKKEPSDAAKNIASG